MYTAALDDMALIFKNLKVLLVFVALSIMGQTGLAAQNQSSNMDKQRQSAIDDVRKYCEVNGDTTKTEKIAWQMRALSDVEMRLSEKMAALDEKIAELKKWVAKRDEILRRAEGKVVAIYSSMRAEAASLQLSTLDDSTAISILLQLKPRRAGAILAEMPPERAAYLTDTMALLTARAAKGVGL